MEAYTKMDLKELVRKFGLNSTGSLIVIGGGLLGKFIVWLLYCQLFKKAVSSGMSVSQ
jgi:hypothetical protein